MIPPGHLARLFLLLALAVSPVVAQEGPGAEAESSAQPQTPAAPPGAKSSEQGAAAPDKQGPAGETATESATTDNDSPFDYRSSEEISEDLSVSFPVDI